MRLHSLSWPATHSPKAWRVFQAVPRGSRPDPGFVLGLGLGLLVLFRGVGRVARLGGEGFFGWEGGVGGGVEIWVVGGRGIPVAGFGGAAAGSVHLSYGLTGFFIGPFGFAGGGAPGLVGLLLVVTIVQRVNDVFYVVVLGENQ